MQKIEAEAASNGKLVDGRAREKEDKRKKNDILCRIGSKPNKMWLKL